MVRISRSIALGDLLGHMLFLMFGTAAEHRIEAQAKEGRDHRENDDLNDHVRSFRRFGPLEFRGGTALPSASRMVPEMGTNYK